MNKKMILGAAGLILLAASCKNDDDTVLIGGKGGNATLHITARHHARTIDSAMVYIKYNATNLPTSFDDSAKVVKTATDTTATISGLKKGTYYLYGYGWDKSIGDTVLGGVPYTITAERDINLILQVTEGD